MNDNALQKATRPFRFGVGPGGLTTDIQAWPAYCRRLEDLGFYSVSVGDHPSLPRFGPIAAMAAACAATTRLRVGGMVFGNDFRHPLVLAREIATLDQVCGGRLEFGLGAGWLTEDYAQFGFPHDPVGRRIERMDEAVRIVKRYFTGETFSHDGVHYKLRNVTGWPRPLQDPHPPLVLGGGGPRMLGLAAREADVVDFNFVLKSGNLQQWAGVTVTRAAMATKLALVKEQAGIRFRSLRLSITIHALVVGPHIGDAVEKCARTFSMSPEDILDSPHFLIGEQSAVIEKILALREEYGISGINLSGNMIDAAAPLISRLAGASAM